MRSVLKTRVVYSPQQRLACQPAFSGVHPHYMCRPFYLHSDYEVKILVAYSVKQKNYCCCTIFQPFWSLQTFAKITQLSSAC